VKKELLEASKNHVVFAESQNVTKKSILPRSYFDAAPNAWR